MKWKNDAIKSPKAFDNWEGVRNKNELSRMRRK
jgi:hypothetical protein